MSHLGSFGAAVREVAGVGEPDTFGFFDETFTVLGTIPPMLMLQIGAAATGKIDDQEGLAALWEAMRCSLTPPPTDGVPSSSTEFDRLYKVAVRQCCDLEELARLAMALFERQAGRPTEEPQGSLPGQSTTSQSSSDSSSVHPAFAHLTPVGEFTG